MNVITLIEALYPILSKTEKRIADYVLEHKDKVGYQTLQEISQFLRVGEASVLRFCRKIGLKGFNELKLWISKEEAKNHPVFQNYVEQIQESLHRSIDNTYALQKMEDLNLAVEWISQAKRVFLYGFGTSALTALDAQAKFLRYGKLCTMLQDSHFQMMSAAISQEDDVILAFSLSGYTKDMLEVLELIKKNGTKIIAITNHINSPMAQLADLILLTYGKENPMTGGSLSAKISQLYIVDILSTGYALLDKNYAQEMLEKTSASVIQKAQEK